MRAHDNTGRCYQARPEKPDEKQRRLLSRQLRRKPRQQAQQHQAGRVGGMAGGKALSYSGADLISQVTQGNGTLTYEYDTKHNITKATNDGLSMATTYDGKGNTTLLPEKSKIPAVSATAADVDELVSIFPYT